ILFSVSCSWLFASKRLVTRKKIHSRHRLREWACAAEAQNHPSPSVPDMHCRQCMQLPELQPTPTRCPTVSPLAFGPTAVTRPTTSWPRIAGYCEKPQSLFKTERSE